MAASDKHSWYPSQRLIFALLLMAVLFTFYAAIIVTVLRLESVAALDAHAERLGALESDIGRLVRPDPLRFQEERK